MILLIFLGLLYILVHHINGSLSFIEEKIGVAVPNRLHLHHVVASEGVLSTEALSRDLFRVKVPHHGVIHLIPLARLWVFSVLDEGVVMA